MRVVTEGCETLYVVKHAMGLFKLALCRARRLDISLIYVWYCLMIRIYEIAYDFEKLFRECL